MKIRLVNFYGNNNLTVPAHEGNIKDWFDIEFFDRQTTYDKANTVFIMNNYQYLENKPYIDKLIENGHKFVSENLCESSLIEEQFRNHPNVLHFYCANEEAEHNTNIHPIPMFFWYRESRSFRDYKQLIRLVNIDKKFVNKKFLLLMNLAKPFRDNIYNKFLPILDDAIYSYVGKNKHPPDDIPRDTFEWDRFINIDWYNHTEFSVVVETNISMSNDRIFITEKTMKPIALRHPFVSLSCPGTLRLLKKSGFETFENLFDESYDLSVYPNANIDSIYTQVKDYNHVGYDFLTQQKLEHNHNWFYNEQEITRRFTNDIVNPILEFVNG